MFLYVTSAINAVKKSIGEYTLGAFPRKKKTAKSSLGIYIGWLKNL